MNYSYLILVAAGLALSVFGFIRNGKSGGRSFSAALMFLAGMVALVLGILLTSVPGFFGS
ncbi:hypothetical protein CSA37_12275 [Candidatus Fermentibacteria bacterium]|nr:MAG: hypothetical protein CSA37_12275 [Candidatus Fermentibacteria bacterium]